MSGVEFLHGVRKRFPQIPVIVITAVAAEEMPKEVTADAYYHKNGFEFDSLLQTIRQLTRKSPLRIARPHINNEPSRARWDSGGQCVVECPECMRPTVASHRPRFIHGEPLTTCSHYRGVIPLRIDQEN
jgi:DNA-binding NtrC family response regulator